MSSDLLYQFLVSNTFRIPTLIIFVVGAALSYGQVRRGRGSQFTIVLLAFLLFLIAVILGIWASYWQISAIDRGDDFREISSFLTLFSSIQLVINTAAWILLLVGIFRSNSAIQHSDSAVSERGSELQGLGRDENHPLYGVAGWLRFFVLINLYISPVIFVISYALAWVGLVDLVDDYPGMLAVVLIETLVGGFLIIKWIQIALHLRGLRPDAAVEAKLWLKLTLAWILLGIPLSLMSGLPAEVLVPQLARGVIQGVIGFAIWYSYFCVSRRVKATFPERALPAS